MIVGVQIVIIAIYIKKNLAEFLSYEDQYISEAIFFEELSQDLTPNDQTKMELKIIQNI